MVLKTTLIDRIQYAYWDIIPYDYRPGQLWYRFKCWAWKRYSVVKPRYLPYTWCDKDLIMAHAMFELLSKFIEDECSPGIVAWYGVNGHKIEVNGKEVYVRDEMQALYDWWHKEYNEAYQKGTDAIHDEAIDEPLCDENGMFCMSDYNKSVYKRASQLEQDHEKQLDDNLLRLLKIRRYMWT